MAEIKWIKISCDMFNDEAIKLIEQMPDGDAIIVVWLKLLIMAGKINDSGYLYFKKEIPYTDEMLSTVFCRPLNTIRLALKTFENFGMIQITDEQSIYITNWKKYQNIEGMERARELAKMRKRKQRAKEKALLIEIKNNKSDVTSSDGHVTVTALDRDIDKELDIDIDKDIEIKEEEKKKKNFVAKSFFQKLIAEDEEVKEYISFSDSFLKFLQYKTDIKKQFKTGDSVKNAFLKFARLANNDINYGVALVENAIARGWQSIYDLPKEDKIAFQKSQNQNQSAGAVDDWESRCM